MDEHNLSWPEMSTIHLHRLWVGLPVGIGIIGLFVVVLSFIGVSGS